MTELQPNRIEEVRKAKGLSLEELAERSGLSPSFISRMSRGDRNVSIKNLEALAGALSCQVGELIVEPPEEAADEEAEIEAAPAETMAELLPNRIDEVRRERGLSLDELSERAGLSPSYVSLMARGKRNVSLKNLARLAEALDCLQEDLIRAPTRSAIGDVIRDARRKRGWTQGYVGEKLNVSPSAVSMWESGTFKPALPMLRGLSKLFDIPTDTLLAAFGDEGDSIATLEPAVMASQIDPVLQVVWEKMSPKQRRKLVQIAVILAEDK